MDIRQWMRKLACSCGLHAWGHEQEIFESVRFGLSASRRVVIAWRCCRRCAASRLTHIFGS